MDKLFAVYLGGEAKGATLEVHDVAFVIGPDIKSTFQQLRELWFGTPDSIHIDSWAEITHVDGFKVTLSKKPATDSLNKLYFINVGSYTSTRFGENHYFLFRVFPSEQEAKTKAKAMITAQGDNFAHTDNIFEVDSVKEISKVRGLHVVLEKTYGAEEIKFTNVYWPLDKDKPVFG